MRLTRSCRLFLALLSVYSVVVVTFAGAQNLLTGRGPAVVVSADFNGDGKLDLATVNRLSGTVSIFVNRGDGQYLKGVEFKVGSSPVALAAADFEGKGKLDLLVANRDGNEVVVLRGDGQGGFGKLERLLTVDHPTALTVADLTHTGRLSLAVANEAGKITVAHFNGQKLMLSDTYAVGKTSSHLLAADLHKTGMLDLAVTDAKNQTVSVLRNRGDGSFELDSTQALKGIPVGIASLSMGSSATLAIGRNGQSPVWISGSTTKPTVRDAQAIGLKGKAAGVQVAVADQKGNTVWILGNDASGTLRALTHITFPTPSSATLVDTDGSGNPKVVVSNYGASQVSVLGSPTTTTLNSSLNPSEYGQTVTLTVNVAATSGPGTPHGQVTLYDGATSFGTRSLDGSGNAQYSFSTLMVGTHNFSVQYLGSGSTWAPSTSSTVPQVVSLAASTVALSQGSSTTNYGESVTFDVTVTASNTGAGTPNGLVSFDSTNAANSQHLGTRSLDGAGHASVTFPALSGGNNSVTATYQGSPRVATGTGNVSHAVNRVASSASLVAAPNPVSTGVPVTLTGTVTGTAPASNYENPQGTVNYFDGHTLLGTVAITRGVTTTTLPATFSTGGFHYLHVEYSGDGNYLPSDDITSPFGLKVTIATTTTMAPASQTGTYNVTPLTFTATVTPVSGSTPTGFVTFFFDGNNFGTRPLDGSGVATLTSKTYPKGTHTLTATYLGSSQDSSSNSSNSASVTMH